MQNKSLFRRLSIETIKLWLIFFALFPFLLIFLISFLHSGDRQFFHMPLTWENYRQLLDPLYLKIFWRSLKLAGLTTMGCLILGYPCAYLLARMESYWRTLLIILLVIPFWTSSLIRVYSIIILFRAHGLLNSFLLWLGFIQKPLPILYTEVAVLIGSIYSLLPFMILPLYANLDKFNWQLLEAARDLGAKGWRLWWKIIIPLSLSGIVSGIILVFLPTMTLFFIPDILGGSRTLLLGGLIKYQFIEGHNWPMGSAVSMVLTLLLIILLWFYSKTNNKISERPL